MTDAQLEELDYRRLYSAFSSKGRNPVTDPRVLFKVLCYAEELQIRKQYVEKRAISEANITTEEGILLRICRSIQVEGAFGLLKNDFGFRRFLTRGKRNVRTELFLLGMGFNLKKLWKKRQANRLKTHLSTVESA